MSRGQNLALTVLYIPYSLASRAPEDPATPVRDLFWGYALTALQEVSLSACSSRAVIFLEVKAGLSYMGHARPTAIRGKGVREVTAVPR